jgi:16S rRNA (cytosine967-C5)-methyltransferase
VRFQIPRENPAAQLGARPTARLLAFEVLRDRERGGAFTEDLLEARLARVHLAPADRALCQELAFGVVRWQAALDWLVARNTGGRTQLPDVQILLRLGLYQLFCLDRIPLHAAVDETVELAKVTGCGAQTGFINGLLRAHAREHAATRAALAELKRSHPHLGWSHPEWLVRRWLARWGAEAVARLLEWNNAPPAVFARVNTLRTDAARLLERWRMENVNYDFVRREGLRENSVFLLKSPPPLARLESFNTGGFYVQDPSTLFAVGELAPQSGEMILDLCAAPGGKTTAIAARMNNSGHIVAVDDSPVRLKLLAENCRRLGVTCVEAVATPPAAAGAGHFPWFDRALVDAPCSNTGVLRRRVDLRWRLREGDLAKLARTQLELLASAAARLKPGGLLVYSTCSLEPEENENVVRKFLDAHHEFTLEGERELLPFRDAMDGAFVARLRRRARS